MHNRLKRVINKAVMPMVLTGVILVNSVQALASTNDIKRSNTSEQISQSKAPLTKGESDAVKKNKIDRVAAKVVSDEIAALKLTTKINAVQVEATRSAYNKLTTIQKRLVENLGRLITAEKYVQIFKDTAAAKVVSAEIAALKLTTTINAVQVETARADYNKLTTIQKKLVKDLSKLATAEKYVLAAAAKVSAEIKALPAKERITLKDATNVSIARLDYTKLTTGQKALVYNITKLKEAEVAIKILTDKALQKPVITYVSIVSNNADKTKAQNGDIITLTFTANSPVTKLSSFKINGNDPDTFTNVGNVYTATHLVGAGDTIGQIATFRINVKNAAGIYSQTIEQTTTGSSVTIVATPVTALEAATTSVAIAETSKTNATRTAAQTLVTALPAGADKNNLQTRIDVIVTIGDDLQKALINAYYALESLENSNNTTEADILKAVDVAINSNVISSFIVWFTKTDATPLKEGSIGFSIVLKLKDNAVATGFTLRIPQIPIVGVTLTSIAIKTSATKLTYTVGDVLDITGLVIEGINSNNSKKVENVVAEDVTGFNSTTAVTSQVLTVTIDEKTITYTVKIVTALEAATTSVATAETSKTDATRTSAQTLVTALPEGTDKNNLQARIDVIVTKEDDDLVQLEAAVRSVQEAEVSKTDYLINRAQALVTALPDGASKNGLQTMIDYIVKAVNDLAKATASVAIAETSKTDTTRITAQTLVTALLEGTDKAELQARIDAIVTAEDALANDLAKATASVATAETSKTNATRTTAQTLVTALPEGTGKYDLQARIDLIVTPEDDLATLQKAKEAVVNFLLPYDFATIDTTEADILRIVNLETGARIAASFNGTFTKTSQNITGTITLTFNGNKAEVNVNIPIGVF